MVTCTITPCRAAVRLNSGVRPVQKQMPVNKRQAKLGLFSPRLSQAFDLRHKLRAGQSAGTPFLGLASRKERLSALDSGQMSQLVKSNGWHRSNNSFKPSPLRGLVRALLIFTRPRPQSGPA